MMKTYRRSALFSAGVRMWRGWRVIVPVIVAGALVQALLVWPPFTYDQAMWTWVSAALSAIAMWAVFACIAASAIAVPAGSVSWAQARARLGPRLLPFALWSVVWFIVVAIGMALYLVPGIVIAAVLVFLPFAVLEGDANPLAAALRPIGERFWRWLITVVIATGVLTVAWMLGGFTAFFLRGPLATVLVWLVGGTLVAWVVTAFALIFVNSRSAPADH